MINDIFHLLWTSDFKIRYNITFLRCYVILLILDFLFHFFFLLLIFLQILILNYISARNCKNRPENFVV